MNREVLSADPMSESPVDPVVLHLLNDQNRFSGPYLHHRTEEQTGLIKEQLGRMSIVLDMSTPLELDPVPIILDEDAPVYAPGSYEDTYNQVRKDPVAKFEFDTELADELLSKLGPTNKLRSREGYDAGFEIGRIVHLLERDFAALPQAEQLSGKRITEALLREELALLWKPTVPKKFEDNPHKAYMFDLSDPNIFTDEQLKDLSESDRWKLIGARLNDEAAELFQGIAESSNVDINEQLSATCRMTDMKIRSLRIQAGMSIGKAHKQELYAQIATLNTEYLGRLAAIWRHPSTKAGRTNSLMFELFVVGQERDNLIKSGDVNKLVRLALPREDAAHPEIYPYINRDRVLVNMSLDVIVDDINGNFVQGYQVKAMPEARYEELQRIREEEKGELVYLKDRTNMRFADSYLPGSGGVDLSHMLRTRDAA